MDLSHSAEYRRVFPIAGWINSNNNTGGEHDDDGGEDGEDDEDVHTHVLKVPSVAPKESRKIKRKVVPCANGKNYNTNQAYAVNLPKRILDVNPKKVCHSNEDIFEDQWKANSKVAGMSEAGRRMFVPTEVRVLNESYVTTAIATPRPEMSDSSIPASRTSHVKAALPLSGHSTVATSWKNFHRGNAFSHNLERESENFDCHSLITNGDLVKGSEKQDTKIRLNEALTRSSGLDRLREKIKQQQLACKEHSSLKTTESSAHVDWVSSNATNKGDVDTMMPERDCPSAIVESSDSLGRASQSCDFNNNGLISAYSSGTFTKKNFQNHKNNHVVKTRKIAANVSTPSYKGFSRLKEKNTENVSGAKRKVKQTDVKSANTTTGKAVTRTKVKKAAKTQETQQKPKPKAMRAVCRTNEIDIITPSSWKKGHEVVLRILGAKPKVQPAKTKPALQMVDLQTIPTKLPQTAREMIEDLQLGRQTDPCINDNHEHEPKSFERPKTKDKEVDKPTPISSILKRKPKYTVLESEKQPKVRHYDPEEVRKFIAKKKTERVQKAKENQEALHNEFIKRQERLREVYRKQKEATALILRKDNNYPSKKPLKESVCFDNMSLFDSEDSAAVSSKAKVSDDSEDSTEEMEEDSTTSRTSLNESMSQDNDAACNKCTCHLSRTHSLQNPTADRIPSDHFYHSLLSTNKPVNPPVPGPISRTQLVTRQWSADLNRLHDLRESAATLTHKIKEMCQTSNFPISSSNIIPEEEPVFAGAKTDQSLPGVQNMQQKAAEIFDKKEKDAATCIQAVYRGYTVRKNLHWQRLTGQTDFSEKANRYLEKNSVSSCDEAHTPPPRSKVKEKLCFENMSVSSDEMTTPPKTTDFPNPTSRFKNLHCDYTELLRRNEVDEHVPDNSQEVDTSWLCKPASFRYPWKKDDMSDNYSVVNIFTSKYRTCNKAEIEDSAQKETPSLENSQPMPLISSSLHLSTNDLNGRPPQHHHPTTQLLESLHNGLPRLKAPTAVGVIPFVSLDTFERNNSCERENQEVMATASLGNLPSQKISLVSAESKETQPDKLPDEIHTSSRIKSPLSINPVIQTNGDSYGLQDLHSSSSCGDSEAENQSTIEISSQILSSVGDGTDSDVSSLQNDLPSKSMCAYQSQFPVVGGYSTKEGDAAESAKKKYSPAQLPMKLRAELYNWEQTVESISLAQQETFSLGRIFQTQSQNPEPNLHYLEQMRRAMALLDNNTTSRVPPAEPVISSPEHSDPSVVLKSIMAEEKQPASQKSYSQSHSLISTVTSQNTHASKETSVSDDQPANGKQLHHKAVRHSSSLPSASIPSHSSQKRHSHRTSSQRSSSNFIKTLSDARNHSDSSSGTVTEDISASSGTDVSSTSQPSEYLTKTSSSSKRRVVHNKENLPSKKPSAVTRKDLPETQEFANSIQHHSIMKDIEEILPQLSKQKQNIVTEVPRVMAEFQLLTAQQENERRAYYAKMKKFFTSKETPETEKENSNKNKSKSDSEVSNAETHAANASDSLQFHIENLQQKTLTETCLGLYTLEKRLKYESKELHRLRKAAEKSCEEKVIQQSRDSLAKEGRHHERLEKTASRRRHENASAATDESYASTIAPSWKEKNSSSSKSSSTSKTLHHTTSGSSSGSNSKTTSSIGEELSRHLSSSIGESISSKNKSQKNLSGGSNSATSNKSIPEAIKTLSGSNENDISHSSSIKEKIKPSTCESRENTPITEEYSHTFETSVNNSLKTSLRQLLSPLVGNRNNSLSFRSSCQKRRGSESDTEDSFHSETLSDVSDIEVRIRALSEDLKKKKAEADRLRRERRNKHREKLKAQEESLVKQIEAYDRYINQANEDLQREQETLQRNVVVKPQIKQPKVLESRRFRQQSPPDVSSSKLSLSQSRESTGSSTDEALSSPLSPMKSEFHETATCSVALTPRPTGTGSYESEKASPLTSIKASVAEEITHSNISEDIINGNMSHHSRSLVGMKDLEASLKQPSDDVEVQLSGKMDGKNVVPVSGITEKLDTTEKSSDKKPTENAQGDFSSTSKGLESSLSTEIAESISEEISSTETEGSGKSKDDSELMAGIVSVVGGSMTALAVESPSSPLPTTSPPPLPLSPPPPLPPSSPPPSSPPLSPASSPPASPPASPPPPLPSSSPPPPPSTSPPPPPTSSPPPPSSSPQPQLPSSSPPASPPLSPTPPQSHSSSLPLSLPSSAAPLPQSISEPKPNETTKSKDFSEKHDDSSTLSGHYYSDDFEVDKSWTSHPSHCSESAAGRDVNDNETSSSLHDDNTDEDISEQIPLHSETSNSSRSYPLKLSLSHENFVKEDMSVNGNRSVACVMSKHVDTEHVNETESEKDSGDNVFANKKTRVMNVDIAIACPAGELSQQSETAADVIDMSEKLPEEDDSSESEKIHEAGVTISVSEEASESKMSWQESEKEGVSKTSLQESEKEHESKMKWQEQENRGESKIRWQESKKEVVSKTSLQESEKESEPKTLSESESEKEYELKMRLQEPGKENELKTRWQESKKEVSKTNLEDAEKEGEFKTMLQESESEKELEPKLRLQESEKVVEPKMRLQESEKESESKTRWQESKKEGMSKTSLQESEKDDESKITLQEPEKECESKTKLQELEKEHKSKMKWQELEKEEESKTSWLKREEESKEICESKKTDQTVCDSEKVDKAICDSASVSEEETSALTAFPKPLNATQTTTTTTISITGGDVAVMKELQPATDVTMRKDVEAELQDSPETSAEKKVSRDEYVEKLVCDLVDEFVSQSITTVCEVVANRKQTTVQSNEVVLLKPKRKSLSVSSKASPPATATSAREKSPESGFNTQQQYFVDEMVASLVDDAVGNIVDIHNRKLSATSPSASPAKKGKVSIDLGKVTTQRGSHFEQSSSFEEDLFVWTLSPESESSDDLGTADVEDADKMENVSRPHSPLPSHMKKTPDSADTDDFFGDFDLTPYKPPPPYPGSKENDAIAKPELLKITKEYYAVPHKREEIQQLVTDAVEIIWQDKQKGIQLEDIALPDTFLSITGNLSTDFDEHSCRSYKTMLFDLTREIVSEIYEDKRDKSKKLHKSDQEDQSEGMFAQLLLQNNQLNINKYYRTHSKPPACLDKLKLVVEKAMSSLLHLDGEAVPCGSSSRGHEFDKWKTSKKDHVDRILVQELQDEEPQWVNYDSDELQLKLQLTNSIMDSLIGNTVDTFKHIYNKHSQWQHVQL